MTTLAIIAGMVLLGVAGVAWYVKRKLGALSKHLPAALEQWEEEIKNLEKPKG